MKRNDARNYAAIGFLAGLFLFAQNLNTYGIIVGLAGLYFLNEYLEG